MQNIIIGLILVLVIIVGIRASFRHFKGEGGCCGGPSAKPGKKKLKNKVQHTYVLTIEGMYCKNCVNEVTGIINDFDGASGKVSLKERSAKVLCDRDVDIEKIKEKIRSKGFVVF